MGITLFSTTPAQALARSLITCFGLAVATVLCTGPSAQAQGIDATCDGAPRTLDVTYQFPARTGDVYINVQDDSMALVRAFDTSLNQIGFANLRVNETFTVPAGANGGTVLASIVNALAGTPRVKCGEAAAASVTPTFAARASVTVQASVTQTAINTNVQGRFGGSGISADANGLTVSTRGLDTAIADLGEPELNAWVGIEGRRLSGTTTGESRNLSFGIDRLVSPNLVVGGYVSYNDQTATVGGATTTTRSPLFGLYAARKLNNGLFLSGFVGYGRPDYTTGATRFTATRQVVGLSLSGQFDAGGLRLTPLASLLASREDLPAAGTFAADRLENTQASLSVRAEPAQRLPNGILPYVTLGAEYRRQGSNAVAFDTFTKPRLGLGVNWQLAAGSLRFDVDYGAITSTANDMGASLVYDFTF